MPRERLLAVDRQKRILDILDTQSTVRTSEISKALAVSSITVRNDFAELEKQGKLKRTHGGAVSLSQSLFVATPEKRAPVNADAKERIAAKAAEFVADGDSVLIDTGSTALAFARALIAKRDLTVVTNDCSVADVIERHMPSATIVLLGGVIRRSHRYTYGRLACDALSKLYLDKAFMAANSFMPDMGFMTEFEPESTIKSLFMTHAKKRYMLIDASKLGRYSYIGFAQLEDFDAVIIDADPTGLLKDEIGAGKIATKLLMVRESGDDGA